jgi:hypothetical protein
VLADVAWHMGGLHPAETWLVLLVAFGPFLVIGLLVRRERRLGASDAGAAGDTEAGAEEDQRSP